ncbi:MAG: hypothetical protein U1E28_15785 [Beijerinckiaceae bacterium]
MSDELSLRAAEYALGTLDPQERTAFARLLATDPAARAALSEWEDRLAPMADLAAPVEPSPDLWARIDREVDSIASGSNVVQLKRAPRWGLRTAMLGAIAAGLAVFAVVSMPTQQPIVKPGTQQVAQADIKPQPAPSVATASATATANSSSATVAASAAAPQGNGSVATASAAAPQGNGSVATASSAAPQGNGSVATASAAAPQGNGSVATASAAAPQGNGSVATASAAAPQGAGVSLAIGGRDGGISVGGEQRPAATGNPAPASFYVAALSGSATPELSFRVDPAAGLVSVSRVGGDLAQSLEIWIVPAGGAPVAVGFLAGANGSFPLPANLAIDAAEIAVSVESQPVPPDSDPRGPFVLRGRLARE